ncbi:gamma-glutamyl-gamma-aminobutyrate hydrolase family protein [Caballeronia sp. NK8]|uniref:gamma-glutamyl-gamma-aminobutyrate hydrolase family protein n=1 Tax=Caballeronia sp. NK8 TaxID=140098 RepID=UPI001BB5DB7A|nr:type 1 glutamine amidotransferase [Caballeronia sp. NK8]BCQ23956.1 gamma-glutamyl-gamma-aminobutyrate hydrolase family protein [Caballeronia sp. NK8]
MSDNKTSNDASNTDARRSGADSQAANGPSGANPTAPPEAAAAASAPGPKASATERASTDAPSSASNVEPVDTAQARRDDAQQAAREARASAASATAAQEASVRDKQRASANTKASLAENLEAATEAEAASTANSQSAATDSPTGRTVPPPAVGMPPAFSDAPDFGKLNPPVAPPPEQAAAPAQPAYLKQSDSAWSVFGRIVAARARQIFDRAGQRITQRTLRIGVSARIFHPEPGAKGLRGKTLQYLEESIAHWVMSRDVLVFMIPTVGHQGMLHPSNIRLRDYAKHLDGLLLQGGADVSPQSYEERTTRPEWPGDRVRDMYELELLHEFVESGKPVLGVCRGCQLINVAFGGTLYGDIATDVPTAGIHVNEKYDQHRHSIRFPDGSTLVNMFPNQREAIVNSIHHQAVKTLGRDLNIEAVSASDGIIEAVRYRKSPFVVGVQWHPEFHRAGGAELLDCTPLLDTFLRVARETRF